MAEPLKQDIEARLDRGLGGLWYVIAKSGDVRPGRPHSLKVLGRNLVMWRDSAGAVQCVENYCPHRGAKLSLGKIVGDHIVCGYHGVEMTGKGVVARVPALPGCVLEGRSAIAAYEVRESHDAIFAYMPSADRPNPTPLALPYELTDGEHAYFLTTSPWACNHRYALENVADPMHGPYLHGGTFTLSGGAKEDTVEIQTTVDGFTVARVQQQGENFDWANVVTQAGMLYIRVNIPYPPAGGPGGLMRVVATVTPIEENKTQIFFWRTRRVSGLAREAWHFMFRTYFEQRHWEVLEQDRIMLENLSSNAREREMLYQHDIGVTRLRQIMRKMAKTQLEAEALAETQPEKISVVQS